APAGADRQRVGGVGPVGGPVVARDPLLGAGGGVVGDRGVIHVRGGPGAGSGDEHRAPVRADRHRGGVVSYAAWVAWPVVALDPLLGAGGGVVGDRGVIQIDEVRGLYEALAGDEHRVPARAHRQ